MTETPSFWNGQDFGKETMKSFMWSTVYKRNQRKVVLKVGWYKWSLILEPEREIINFLHTGHWLIYSLGPNTFLVQKYDNKLIEPFPQAAAQHSHLFHYSYREELLSKYNT